MRIERKEHRSATLTLETQGRHREGERDLKCLSSLTWRDGNGAKTKPVWKSHLRRVGCVCVCVCLCLYWGTKPQMAIHDMILSEIIFSPQPSPVLRKVETVSCSVVSNSLQLHGLFVDFSMQEYWSELPFHSPGDLPNPGIKPRSPVLQTNSLSSELTQDIIICLATSCLCALFGNV